MYTQVMYALERVPVFVNQRPRLGNRQPFKTILSGHREAIAKLSLHEQCWNTWARAKVCVWQCSCCIMMQT
jgi:hypothetical protein